MSIKNSVSALSEKHKYFLAEICLERVSLSIFAGCVKEQDLVYNLNDDVVKKYGIQSDDFRHIHSVVEEVNKLYEEEPLSFYIFLKSNTIEIHPLT